MLCALVLLLGMPKGHMEHMQKYCGTDGSSGGHLAQPSICSRAYRHTKQHELASEEPVKNKPHLQMT